MPLDTSVKRIHESMRGAPQLKGAAGTGVAVLDAFLVDGWGLATATSGSVSAGVCTLNMGVGNDFEEHCVVLVAGATPAAVNGEHRLTQGGTTIKFETTAADGAVTGTVTVKYAPCGFETVYTASNQRVYRSKNVAGARRYLRVVDTGTIDLRVTGYNTMTSVSAGTGLFPTSSQVSGGGYWPKAMSAGSTAERYDLIGDDMLFYYAPAAWYATYGDEDHKVSMTRAFGDPLPLKSGGDAWCSILGVAKSSSSYSTPHGLADYDSVDGVFVERVAAGTGSAVETYLRPDSGRDNGSSWSGAAAEPYGFGAVPGAVDGKLLLTRHSLMQSKTDSARRAVLPGLYRVPQSGLSSYAGFTARDTVPGAGPLGDRRLMLLWTGNDYRYGGFFVDITGPWR